MRIIASGLRFPEGPVWTSDGSLLLVEIERKTLTRVCPDGRVEVVAQMDGGPNGAAVGPDGRTSRSPAPAGVPDATSPPQPRPGFQPTLRR